MLVPLDGLVGADARSGGVATELSERATLAEEVPALVEGDANLLESSPIGLGRGAGSLTVPELVLLGDELLDVLVDLFVGHGLHHTPRLPGSVEEARPYHRSVVPEAPLEQTESGLAPAGKGWFVINARAARWHDRPGRRSTSLT